MIHLDGSSPATRRMISLRKTCWTRILLVAVTAFALVFSQTAPALAYGPGDAIAGYNDVRAMGYFRLPLGTSQADKDRAPSFGFTVKRQFQFNDPMYETMSGSYRNSQHLTVNAVDLRFGMNGQLSGFDVGGFNALQAKTRLSAADNGDGGTPTWVWLALGGAVVVGGIILAAGAFKTERRECAPGSGGGFCITP